MQARLLAIAALTVGSLGAAAVGEDINFTQQVTTFGTETEANFAMWLPDQRETIRGMAFILPGFCGDARDVAVLPHWQEAAHALGFGLIGTNDNDFGHAGNSGCHWGAFGGGEVQSNLENILERAAELSGQPEIANAPVVVGGTSQGGFNAWLVGTGAPSRVIAYSSVRGFIPRVSLTSESAKVPGVLLVGAFDGIVPPQTATHPGFANLRQQDALVSFVPEWERGHDSGQSTWELGWYWMSEAANLRYPTEMRPSTTPGDPVQLLELDPNSGWLGESTSFRQLGNSTNVLTVVYSPDEQPGPLPPHDGTLITASTFPEINAVASYSGDPMTASWMPTEAFANAYRARTLVDENRPLAWAPGHFAGGPMEIVSPESFLPSNLDQASQQTPLHVGQTVDIRVEPRQFDDQADIIRMRFYEGSRLIGDDNDGPEWSLPVDLNDAGIRGLTVVATNSLGEQTSTFRAILVQPVAVPEPSTLALLVAALVVGRICCSCARRSQSVRRP